MDPSEGKQLIRDIKRHVINARDADAAHRYFAEDYHNDVPGRAPGRAGLQAALREFFAAFPDIHETVDVILAEGDLVASRSTIRATHRGPFLGIPGSGRAVTFAITEISTVRDGKIASQYVTFDIPGLLAQIAPTAR
jgi:steroid delta-isomerase-like uncharacterized protein